MAYLSDRNRHPASTVLRQDMAAQANRLSAEDVQESVDKNLDEFNDQSHQHQPEHDPERRPQQPSEDWECQAKQNQYQQNVHRWAVN